MLNEIMKTSPYLKYAKNIFSQNGDDGIIEKLFSELSISSGVICEFGSWDGIFCSNTCNLTSSGNYQTIMIESDSRKYTESKTTFLGKVDCEIYNLKVEIEGENTLDNIFSKSQYNLNDDNFSLISIDIDSCDGLVWESLNNYRPKVVVLETATGSDIKEERNTTNNGVSVFSANEISKRKNYTLVCHTGNAFFVRNDLVSKLSHSNFTFEDVAVVDTVVDALQKVRQTFPSEYNDHYYLSSDYNENREKLFSTLTEVSKNVS